MNIEINQIVIQNLSNPDKIKIIHVEGNIRNAKDKIVNINDLTEDEIFKLNEVIEIIKNKNN
jgi:hypothetical protein